jgi:hypothetical protein
MTCFLNINLHQSKDWKAKICVGWIFSTMKEKNVYLGHLTDKQEYA